MLFVRASAFESAPERFFVAALGAEPDLAREELDSTLLPFAEAVDFLAFDFALLFELFEEEAEASRLAERAE